MFVRADEEVTYWKLMSEDSRLIKDVPWVLAYTVFFQHQRYLDRIILRVNLWAKIFKIHEIQWLIVDINIIII